MKISIARYLAEKFNLAGKTELERALCNMLVDQIFDMIIVNIGGVLSMKTSPEEKKHAWISLMNEKLPFLLKLIQNELVANPHKSGYLVTNRKPTYSII